MAERKNYTGFRCKIKDWHGLHDGFYLTLRPGYNSLIGPNGAGKTTLLCQLAETGRARGCRVFEYSNYTDGGNKAMQTNLFAGDVRTVALAATSSEGQQISLNLGDAAEKLHAEVQDTIRDGKPLLVLMDSLDSGLSIDKLDDVMGLFRLVEKDADVQPGGAKHPVYIAVAANSYELARFGAIDVRTGKPVSFGDYGDYARFIRGYFDTHRRKEE